MNRSTCQGEITKNGFNLSLRRDEQQKHLSASTTRQVNDVESDISLDKLLLLKYVLNNIESIVKLKLLSW